MTNPTPCHTVNHKEPSVRLNPEGGADSLVGPSNLMTRREAGGMSDSLAPTRSSSDALTAAMEDLDLRCWVPGPFHLSAPWALHSSGRFGWCHLLRQGECCLHTNNPDRLIHLDIGDLVIVQQGTTHTLADAPETPANSLEKLLRPSHFDQHEILNHGGGGARVRVNSVCFLSGQPTHSPLLSLMPDIQVVQGQGYGPSAHVDCIFQLIAKEAEAGEPCAQTIINRLVRILLIKSFYSHGTPLPTERIAWLKALVDPAIGPALALMHQHPEEPWTVASLANEVAMSRTAFAVRFTETLGKSPLEYLTEWRMQRACSLLAKSQASIKEIAAQVGYDSAASFSKAFARWAGVAPKTHREQIRDSAAHSRIPPDKP